MSLPKSSSDGSRVEKYPASKSTKILLPENIALIRIFGIFLSLAFVFYTILYLSQPSLPGNSEYPQGWWGWFDQGQYIGSSRSFSDGTWRTFDHFYPPAYSWLGSFFIRLWPANPFFLIDFLGLSMTLAAMLVIGRRWLRLGWVLVGITLTFILFPMLTIMQWEIPWTTSLSSGIGGALLLGLSILTRDNWRISTPIDWAVLLIFSFLFGSLSAVRPLDVLAWSPVAITFYACIAWNNLRPRSQHFNFRRALMILAVVVAFGMLTPSLYIYFNEITTGTIMGTYVVKASANGYQVHSLIRKTVSLLFDSSPVYFEKGQALASEFWPLYVALPAIAYIFFRQSLLTKALCLAIVSQVAIYIPYCDLVPNSLFRYYNVHYFKWIFPWLTLFSIYYAYEVSKWRVLNIRAKIGAVAVIAASGGLFLIGLQAHVVGSTEVAMVREHRVEIVYNGAAPLDFIDLTGVTGSFQSGFLGSSTLEVDGVPFPQVSKFRLISTAWGVRLILSRTLMVHRLDLQLDPGFSVESSLLTARSGAVSLSFSCRLGSTCDLLAPVPMVQGPVTLALADASTGRFLQSGWNGIESWGRWTSSVDATIAFRVPMRRDIPISLELRPFLFAARAQQTVTLLANGCKINSISFDWSEAVNFKSIEGTVPAACISENDDVKLDLKTTDAVTPHELGMNSDERPIGVGVRSLSID